MEHVDLAGIWECTDDERGDADRPGDLAYPRGDCVKWTDVGNVIVKGHDFAGIHGHGLYRFHVGHGRDLVRRWRDAGGPLACR